ncbi:hypothetical protein AMTR_s00003p00244580 [Amborella trichopoda]|uniref:Uncharacterized protein n=1 Tax=Amborella trichopoda TaxID=13333 RepID=W1P6Q3_AMBTC|nr:hypothetical protein AMTR_s00003p00244580 [Amborella trichopoda]
MRWHLISEISPERVGNRTYAFTTSKLRAWFDYCSLARLVPLNCTLMGCNGPRCGLGLDRLGRNRFCLKLTGMGELEWAQESRFELAWRYGVRRVGLGGLRKLRKVQVNWNVSVGSNGLN